jgi:D-3-phosphoglycerate dehydrogenase
MKLKIVVTDCSWENIDVERKYLPQNAIVEGYQCKTEEEVIEVCKDADAVLSEYAPLTRKVLESLNKCKIISNTAIGTDNIDVNAASEMGIAVANVPGYCVNEVADHTMALILSSSRNIVKFDREVRKQKWDIAEGYSLKRLDGQTLGLVGFGEIARQVATRAQSFGMNVLAYDPYVKQELASSYNVKLVELKKLLAESDIISSHLPLNNSTFKFFNKDKFSKMEKRPLFVNTSRGGVVDENDLIEAIETGVLSGAALDVLADEPPCFSNKIFKLDNVIITPHVGFLSETALEEVRKRSAQNVKNFFNKKYKLVNFVNKAINKQ